MAGDDAEHPEVSFGDFRIEGLDDPLAPRTGPGYVEEIDADPAPAALPTEGAGHLPWLGARPWSGVRDLGGTARSVGRGAARGATFLAAGLVLAAVLVVLGVIVVWVAVRVGG